MVSADIGTVLGDVLPSAVGVAISPVPIIAVVLMLGSTRARSLGPLFAIGWCIGLVVVCVAVLLVAGGEDEGSDTSTAAAWVKLALGIVFVLLAAQQWRGRPRGGAEPALPSWMQALDQIPGGKALGLGIALSAVNPKNLALTAAAASTIALGGLSSSGDAVCVAVFVAIGSATVVVPVLAALVAGDRVLPALRSLRDAMAEHNAVIMTVVLLVLGAKLIGDAISTL